MYQDLLPYLRCPHCLDTTPVLAASARVAWDGDIIQGGLRCPRCTRLYPIKHGVPDLTAHRVFPASPAQFVNFVPPTAWLYERLWRPQALTLLTGEAFGYQREVPLIRHLIAPERGGLYLDLACSTGLYARAIDRGLVQGHVVGIDHALPMLYQARAYAAHQRQRISFVCASAQALPFASSAVAGIAMGGSLNEIGDVTGCLHEIHRVLSSAGRCVLMSLGRSQQPAGRFIQRVFNGTGIAFWSASELHTLFQNHTLRLVAQWQYGLVLFSLVVPAERA